MDRYCEGTKEKKHKKTLMVSPYGEYCTCSWVCPVCNAGFVLEPCHCQMPIEKKVKGGKHESESVGKEGNDSLVSSA